MCIAKENLKSQASYMVYKIGHAHNILVVGTNIQGLEDTLQGAFGLRPQKIRRREENYEVRLPGLA